jgi:hypothetical protein
MKRSKFTEACEQDLGDGLRPRSARDRAQTACIHDHRCVLAVLPGDRAAVQLSWQGCCGGAGTGRPPVGFPNEFRVDQGTEFVSRDLDLWTYQRDVPLDFSRPGKPTDNVFIKSFNGKFRAECLNADWFLSLDDARRKCETAQRDRQQSPDRAGRTISGSRPALIVDMLEMPAGWSKDGEQFTQGQTPIRLGSVQGDNVTVARTGS